jgi:hypothetical protein
METRWELRREGEFVKMGAYGFGGEDKSGVVELGEHVLQKFGTEFALLSAHLLRMEGQGVVVARAALLIALQHVVSKQLHLLLLQSRSIMNLFALIFFSCSFLFSKVNLCLAHLLALCHPLSSGAWPAVSCVQLKPFKTSSADDCTTCSDFTK